MTVTVRTCSLENVPKWNDKVPTYIEGPKNLFSNISNKKVFTVDQALTRVLISWEKSRVEREISLSISKIWYFPFLFLLSISESGNNKFSFYSRFSRFRKINIFISLSTLDFREFETEILVHFNNGVFGWKKVIWRLQVHFFLLIYISILEKYELSISLLETWDNNFKFLFMLLNSK